MTTPVTSAPAVRAAVELALPGIAQRIGRRELSEIVAIVWVTEQGEPQADLFTRDQLPDGGPPVPHCASAITIIAVGPAVDAFHYAHARRIDGELALLESD